MNSHNNSYFALIYFSFYTHKNGEIQNYHLPVGDNWKYLYACHKIIKLDDFVPFFLTMKINDTWDLCLDNIFYTFKLNVKGCLSLIDVTRKI